MRGHEWRQGLWVGLLLLLIVWLSYLIWGLSGKVVVAFQQEREVRTEYAALLARQTALEADLHALQTERGQDAAIREAFGVAKSGEEVIVLVPPAEATTTPKTPWWKRWFNWF